MSGNEGGGMDENFVRNWMRIAMTWRTARLLGCKK